MGPHAHNAAASSWLLRVVAGADSGKSIRVTTESVVVGSGTTVDFVLTDGGVSRRHLEIVPVLHGLRVSDLASKNGTYLLGVRIDSAVVAVGTEIKLGATTLRIDDDAIIANHVEARVFGAMVTQSVPMMRVFGALARVARTEAPVLLLGEPGTAKRTLAKALHAQSQRSQRPFVHVDLAALKPDAVARALWGVGDTPPQAGAAQRAHGGTLLLHEVGRADAHTQTQLLLLLNDNHVVPIGSNRAIPTNVRVIATSSMELAALRKSITAPLWEALSLCVVPVPPLRLRTVDVAALCTDLLREAGSTKTFSADQLLRLTMRRWPGNIAELSALVARSVALAGDGALDLHDEVVEASTLREGRDAFDKARITELLRVHGGNVSGAARAAGMDRRHLHRLINRYGIQHE